MCILFAPLRANEKCRSNSRSIFAAGDYELARTHSRHTCRRQGHQRLHGIASDIKLRRQKRQNVHHSHARANAASSSVYMGASIVAPAASPHRVREPYFAGAAPIIDVPTNSQLGENSVWRRRHATCSCRLHVKLQRWAKEEDVQQTLCCNYGSTLSNSSRSPNALLTSVVTSWVSSFPHAASRRRGVAAK